MLAYQYKIFKLAGLQGSFVEYNGIMDIEKMFHADIREKKRTASGIFHKKGIRGYVGTMRTPSDILRGKEKRAYRKNGKVEKWNMYDLIISKEEFIEKDLETQKAMMSKWRENYTNKEIMSGMGTSTGGLHSIINSLDLPKKKRVRQATTKAKPKKAQQEKVLPIQEETPPQQILINGLHVEWSGVYAPVQIQKMLDKISVIVEDDEKKKYKVQIVISEQ